MDMDRIFEFMISALDIKDTIEEHIKPVENGKDTSLTPRQQWIKEQMEFQKRTNTGRYLFIPRDDGDYDIIDNGA